MIKFPQANLNKQNLTESLQPNSLPGNPIFDVFLQNGATYLGIRKEFVDSTRALFESGVVDELVADGLFTPSKLIDQEDSGYLMLVKQDSVGILTHPSELPPSMRRDAALVLLRIARALERRGFMILDADLSNITFDKFGKPKFFNICAVARNSAQKFPYAEFHAHFFGPLRLIYERPEIIDVVHRAQTIRIDEDIAIRHPLIKSFLRHVTNMSSLGGAINSIYKRLLLQSPFGGLFHQGRYFTFIREILLEHRARAHAVTRSAGWTEMLIDDIEEKMRRMRFEGVSQRWTSYYDHLDLDAVASAGVDWQRFYQGPREQAILNALDQIPKGTLLDIGANNGYFSLMGAHFGFITTAVDNDIGAIDGLYRILQRSGSKLPVRSLVADFVTLEQHQLKRFEADAVIALGFVHHMRLVELLSWSAIAERLAVLTRKVMVTEFKPGTSARNSKNGLTKGLVSDYTLEELVAALRREFTIVKVVGQYSAVNFSSLRTMIVCLK